MADVLTKVDQRSASTVNRTEHRPITVHAPHEWDGIGQALRCAYGNHRAPPSDIQQVMQALDAID